MVLPVPVCRDHLAVLDQRAVLGRHVRLMVLPVPVCRDHLAVLDQRAVLGRGATAQLIRLMVLPVPVCRDHLAVLDQRAVLGRHASIAVSLEKSWSRPFPRSPNQSWANRQTGLQNGPPTKPSLMP